MSCIDRRPRCGENAAEVEDQEPLSDIGGVLAGVFTAVGVIVSVLTFLGKLTVVAGVLTLEIVQGTTFAIASAAGVGAISASTAGIAIIVLITVFALDRCTAGTGSPECVAGVVNEVVPSFSDAAQEVFPFTAMHDRVDVVVKSRFWDVVESNLPYVHCTDEEIPRRSEILRCYFYDKQVCAAAKGALYGGIGGAVVGVIIGALVAAAITCATIWLCLLALLIALLIAAVAALVGACAGGQVGKAVGEDESPSDSSSGAILTVGDLVTVEGNMLRRAEDDGANVYWWSTSAALHGRATDGTSRPYSYCEIDEQLADDGCPVYTDPPK